MLREVYSYSRIKKGCGFLKLKKTVAVLFVFLIVIFSFGKPVKAYGSSLTLSRTGISINLHTLNPNLDCLLTDFVYAY